MGMMKKCKSIVESRAGREKTKIYGYGYYGYGYKEKIYDQKSLIIGNSSTFLTFF